jgi:hypothetical protein
VAEIVKSNVSLAIALFPGPRTFWLDANRLADGQSTGTSRLHPEDLYTEVWEFFFYFQPLASTKGWSGILANRLHLKARSATDPAFQQNNVPILGGLNEFGAAH